MRRGAAKADTTQTQPLLADRCQGNPRALVVIDVVLAAHGVSSPSTSRANSRNWCFVDSSALRPLAVAI